MLRYLIAKSSMIILLNVLKQQSLINMRRPNLVHFGPLNKKLLNPKPSKLITIFFAYFWKSRINSNKQTTLLINFVK